LLESAKGLSKNAPPFGEEMAAAQASRTVEEIWHTPKWLRRPSDVDRKSLPGRGARYLPKLQRAFGSQCQILPGVWGKDSSTSALHAMRRQIG
jgi:hypothetical protein